MAPYTPILPHTVVAEALGIPEASIIKLDANENPYGPSPMARLAMMENARIGNRYGHSESKDLIALLAEIEGVPEEYILLGPGSSDLLEKTAIVMFHKGGNIVVVITSQFLYLYVSLNLFPHQPFSKLLLS